MSEPLLSVRNLTKHYPITSGLLRREVGRVRAVDGISFDLAAGETLGLVGESGCGKSTAATTLLRLEEPTDGAVVFDGEDVTGFDRTELKRFRRDAQMVFQDPTSSFDPRMTIGESVAEPLRIHGMRDGERRRAIVEDLLERVGMAAAHADRYPHEFSGGQKQRVALARALVVNPRLVVADEPVSALDVSIQAEILALLNDVKETYGLSMLLISHDLGVVREVCDRVAVMYLGEIVEVAPTESLFEEPQHPYTRALLSSIPEPDPRQRGDRVELTGDVPDPSNPPAGCRFHTRCPEVIQPDGYEFEQTAWRAVLDLRTRLADGGLDARALDELVAADEDATAPEAATVSGDATDDERAVALRAEFGIPESLADPDAESVLSEAIGAVLADDADRAQALLVEEFGTVCERRPPEMGETATGHDAACHLHEMADERTVGVPTVED